MTSMGMVLSQLTHSSELERQKLNTLPVGKLSSLKISPTIF